VGAVVQATTRKAAATESESFNKVRNDTADAAVAFDAMDERLITVRPLNRTRQFRQFTDEPVSDEDLFALTEVARWTGSGSNSQPWRFLVVRNVDLIRRIGAIGLPQTRSLHSAMAVIAIVLPVDEHRATIDAYDEGRAAERILIAASMLGIGAGIAWVTSAVRAEIGQLLGLPDTHFVRTLMAVGHPTAEARAPKSAPGQARKPREEMVKEGRWG